MNIASPLPLYSTVTNDTVKVEVWDIVDKGGCGLSNDNDVS